MLGDDRVEDRSLTVIRPPFLGSHRDAETGTVQIQDLDVVSTRPQAGGSAGGEGVAVAVGRRVGDDEGDEHVSHSPAAPVPE